MPAPYKQGKNSRRKIKARQRWVKAVDLATTTDMTYEQIAAACGYSGSSSVWRAIWTMLGERQDEAADKYRALEDARLEQAYDLVLREVEAGNLKAVDALVRLGERRAKLRGLNAPERAPVNEKGDTVASPPVLQVIVKRSDAA